MRPTLEIARRWLWMVVVACVGLAQVAWAGDATTKPVFLYSRYFNAKGEKRYEADGQYRDVMERLGGRFEVRVNDLPLEGENLKGVAVVMIANPSDKAAGKNPPPHHVTAKDVAELTRYVRGGGGLIVMGNQENHNLEIHDMNALLGEFGMRFENRYTDAKQLVIPKDVPIVGGLRWAYYTGNQVVVEANHPARARPLVVNDLAQKPLGGPRDPEGTLLAVAEPGAGRVIVVTDAGWLTNDALSGKGIGKVAIKDHDNWEIFLRLATWAGHVEAAAER